MVLVVLHRGKSAWLLATAMLLCSISVLAVSAQGDKSKAPVADTSDPRGATLPSLPGTFIHKTLFLIIKIINFRGDLTDVPAKTASVQVLHLDHSYWRAALCVGGPLNICIAVCIYTCQLLSQAPTMKVFYRKTLHDLLELPNFGNSTFACRNSLWHFCTPQFFPVGPW